MKWIFVSVFILFYDLSFGQKIKLIDHLNDQILANTRVELNGKTLDTDDEGFINIEADQEFNTIKIKDYEPFDFQLPFNSKEIRVERRFHTIEEVVISPNDAELVNIKNLKRERLTYSFINNVILVNQIKIPSKLKEKRIVGVILNMKDINAKCDQKIYLKPKIFSELNNYPHLEISSSAKVYEMNNDNTRVKLRFADKIFANNRTYFIGFELLNLKNCEKPYKIYSKLSNNKSFYKLRKSTSNEEWFPNKLEQRFINFGIEVLVEK